MKAILLPNEMFDDGSIECRTFNIVHPNERLDGLCDYSWIEKHFAEYIPEILEAMKQNKHYIGALVSADQSVVGKTYNYFEIQWD